MQTELDTTRTAPRPAMREVEGVYRGGRPHWVGDGFRVHGYFEKITFAERKLSPFLLLDYHPPFDYPPTEKPRGVGAHPHRGFETVTIAWQGKVRHRDSAGHADVIAPGDVQWMTAASGIVHEERHEPEWARRGGAFQMAQLWVNLPKAHKMSAPGYQALTAASIPSVALPNGSGTLRVIAGEHGEVKGPAHTRSPIGLFDVRLAAGGRLDLDLPASWNVSILVMAGDVVMQGHTTAGETDLVVFERDGAIRVEADGEAHVLVMAGEPIHEPIARYGPFVMNSQHELAEAFLDFDSGAMGTLDDEPNE